MKIYGYAINACIAPQLKVYQLYASHGSLPSIKAYFIIGP